MTRLDAIAVTRRTLTDEPVVVNLGHAAYELFAAGDRPLNFYTWGSMGSTTASMGRPAGRQRRRPAPPTWRRLRARWACGRRRRCATLSSSTVRSRPAAPSPGRG